MPSEALAPAALETPRSLSHDDAPPAPRRAPQEEWTCGTCTFINVSGATDASLGVELCSVCGTPRMDAVPATAAPLTLMKVHVPQVHSSCGARRGAGGASSWLRDRGVSSAAGASASLG